jgi:hypothetical protein
MYDFREGDFSLTHTHTLTADNCLAKSFEQLDIVTVCHGYGQSR